MITIPRAAALVALAMAFQSFAQEAPPMPVATPCRVIKHCGPTQAPFEHWKLEEAARR